MYFLQIIGQMANLEIAEMCARSGANCGSLFLDLRFRELVRVCISRKSFLTAIAHVFIQDSFARPSSASGCALVGLLQ
jgi:hypothetical protein